MSEWTDIARTGTFTASNGHTVALTAADFDRIIEGFDEKERRIPLVFGHPKTSAPAYGWVESFRRMGDVLQARFKQVHEDVKTLVRNGHFKNISVSLSADKSSIRHIGLLGAAQPAISGLREVSFSDESGDLVLEFGMEEYFALGPDGTTRLEKELMDARAELAELRRKEAEKAREIRLERLRGTVKAGKVTPAEMKGFLSFAEALMQAETEIQFSEASEPVNAVDALIEILEARPVSPLSMDFSELARPGHMVKEDEPTAVMKNPAYLV